MNKLTPTFYTWRNMNRRVNNKSAHNYKHYGGRGIDMDPRWKDLKVFIEDMGERPERMTLGRIDNSRGYWPDNCEWQDNDTQRNNMRTNVFWTFKGETLTSSQWGKKLGIDAETLRRRIKKGWSLEETLTTSLWNREQVLYNGEYRTLREWCEKLGKSHKIVRQRVRRDHWTPEEALKGEKNR